MKKIKLNIFLLTLVLTFTFVLSSCGGKDDKNKTKQKTQSSDELSPKDIEGAITGDWLIKREMADAEKLNPIVTNDASAEEVYLLIYEALNDFDYEKFQHIPKVASLPEISADHMTYTYTLRKDVTFSDGKTLTGEDVIFTMKAIKNPFADDAAMRNYYDKVKNVELVNGDKFKININMNEPYFLAEYTNGDFPICPKHILDPEGLTEKYSWDEIKSMSTADKNPSIKKFADFLNSQQVSREGKYVVGSGPYMFDKWETGQAITIKRNVNYWDKSTVGPYIDKIIFKIIQDNSASVVAAKNKEIDMMFVVSSTDFFKNLENAEQFDLVKSTPSEPNYSYIGWNHKNSLFADKKVRWALSHLVNRDLLNEKIAFNQSVKIQSPIYYKQKNLLNTELPEIKFDPEKAKLLLSEAGWKDSDGDGVLDKVINGKKTDFKFTFLNNNNPARKQTLLVIIDELKKVGIQAELQDMEWTVYLDKLKKHQFDATLGVWAGSVTPPDPYQIFHSSQMEGEGSNYVSYSNPESDKLIEEYRKEFDENKRAELLKKWQIIIYDDQVYTFLFNPKARYISNKRFHNTRWYSKRNSPIMSEWWVPKTSQKFTQSQN